ncbi:hypothetical protein CO037_01065 [Candidatus Pacearchaeota archaeon CG_4_9_14_0_2_um_filter_30_8]|nr:MAG: hypothetical protein CO037_01065 [Candidatus Pacearchaeota archaeon CG_4_9_14_0_2_um_filter_30_8]
MRGKEVKKIPKFLEERSFEVISLIEPNSIYFAHPVSVYNTHLEKVLVKRLKSFFKNKNIYNPNQPHNQKNYKIWKDGTGSGMNYYFDLILPNKNIVGGVYLPFEDGMIGAGIYGEMEKLQEMKKPIFEIKKLNQIEKILKIDSSRKLSIEQTRERAYKK